MRKPSKQTIITLLTFVQSSDNWSYGYELSKETGLKSGVLYPILMRLSDRGFLHSQWEDFDPDIRNRPRHMYRLTDKGREYASKVIREHVRSNEGKSSKKEKEAKPVGDFRRKRNKKRVLA